VHSVEGARQVRREPDLEHQDRDQEALAARTVAIRVAAEHPLNLGAVEELGVASVRLQQVIGDDAPGLGPEPRLLGGPEEADLALVEDRLRHDAAGGPAQQVLGLESAYL